MKSFKRPRMKKQVALPPKSSLEFVVLLPIYIKVPMLPQSHSPLPSTMTITYRGHIDCVTSRVIIQAWLYAKTRPSPLLSRLPPSFAIHQLLHTALLHKTWPLKMRKRETLTPPTPLPLPTRLVALLLNERRELDQRVILSSLHYPLLSRLRTLVTLIPWFLPRP
jgi:hypothetical protein